MKNQSAITIIICTLLILKPGIFTAQETYSLQYDSLNYIHEVQKSNHQKVIYEYDALGNRTAITIPCQPPVNLVAGNITEESATLSWQQVGSFNTWNILWGESGFNPESQGNLIQDISETQLTITNLNPETIYDVYVNSNCDASEQSEWRGPCTFTTTGAVLAIYEVTGGGEYCETDWPNGEIYLSGSQTQVVYQLYKDGIPEGQLKNGNGGMLSWYDLSEGIYTIEGTRNQLSGWMNGSATVSEIGLPDVYAGDDATVSTGESYTFSDAIAQNYSNISWYTMGDGIFNDPDLVNPTYAPGPNDIASQYVELIISASPIAPCFISAEDYVSLSIITPPPQQIITLNEGWSGISSYISPGQTAVDLLFQPIINELIILQGTTGLFWPDENINTLNEWDSYAGYKIKVSTITSLSVTGNYLSNNTILIEEGWNLIPVLSECYVPVSDLFSETSVIVAKEVSGTAVYWPDFSINTLQYLMPGKAYFVLMETESQVTYPDCNYETLPEKAHNYYQEDSYLLPDGWNGVAPTANTHIIAIPSNISNCFNAGDIIGVFSEVGKLCGAALIENHGKPYSITVFGDDPTTTEMDGFTEGEIMHFRVIDSKTGTDTGIMVDYDETLPNSGYFTNHGLSAVASIQLTNIGEVASSNLAVDIHPNPSSGIFNISLNGVDPVKCEVYDVHGVCILKMEKEINDFAVDLSAYPKGIYYLKITQGGLQGIRKLVLQ